MAGADLSLRNAPVETSSARLTRLKVVVSAPRRLVLQRRLLPARASSAAVRGAVMAPARPRTAGLAGAAAACLAPAWLCWMRSIAVALEWCAVCGARFCRAAQERLRAARLSGAKVREDAS